MENIEALVFNSFKAFSIGAKLKYGTVILGTGFLKLSFGFETKS